MNRFCRALPIGLVLVLVSSLPAVAEPMTSSDQIGTILLSLPVAAKAVAPLYFVASGLATDGNLTPGGLLVAAWTVPNAFLLYNIAKGDAKGIRIWRTVNMAVDGAVFVTMLGLGITLIKQPASGENWNDVLGAIGIAISIPFGVSAGIDIIPFPVERRR